MFPVNVIHDRSRQAGLRYLLIGGHAIISYCEPRGTLDVDFMVRRSNLVGWRALLESEGFKQMHDGKTFAQFSPPYGVEWRLDLMLVNDQTFDKLEAGARVIRVIGIESRVPRAEHLIALKLHALKHGHPERFEKDFGDVLSLTRNIGCDVRSTGYRQLFDQFGTPELYEKVLARIG